MSSIPEEAAQVTLSIIDELTVEIIENADEGLGKWEALKYFIKTLPVDVRATKETHELIATILVATRCLDPYTLKYEFQGDSEKENVPFDSMPVPPLVHWDKRHWNELLILISTLHKKLNSDPTDKLEVVCKSIRFHETLSPIRLTLETEIATKSSGAVVIQKSLVHEYCDSIDGIADRGLVQDLKKILHFTRSKISNTSTARISLKPIQDLKKIMETDHFTFHFLQRKISRLMGEWAHEYMGSLGGYLKKREATPSRRITTPSRKKRNNHSAAQERQEREDDVPKDTSSGQKDESASEKRKAVGLDGVRILDDEDVSHEEEDDAIVTDAGAVKRKRRKLFSAEEKNAIKKAALEVGIRSWAAIRYKYIDILQERTPKSIKNCYKTMVKHGEIVEQTVSASSDEDDVEDKNEESHKVKVKVVQVKYSSPNECRPLVRRKWSEEEKAAVRDGVYKYKPGEWAKIKEDPEFQEVLSRRTPGQLKDCYRVMCKNGSINAVK